MTETKFTPGPLVAVRNSAFWEINPENRSGKDPFTVADACASGPNDPDGGLQEANARLRAAAPELYEALDSIFSSIIPSHDCRDGLWVDLTAYQVDTIRTALAKARGETQ